MVEKFELPLKPGAWENIAVHIPVYPSKKKRFAWIKSWGISIFVLLIGSAFLTYKLQQLSQNKVNISETKNGSLSGPKITQPAKETIPLNKPSNVSERYENIGDKSENLKNTYAEVSNQLRKKPLQKRTVPAMVISDHLKVSRSSSYIRDLIPSFENGSISPINHEAGSLTLLLTDFSLKQFDLSSSADKMKLLKVNHSPIRLKKDKLYFLVLSYGAYLGQLSIDPQLMKLPKGKGQEMSLKLGKQLGKWNLSLGLNYSQMQQRFSMGDVHDTTYFKVFKPGFNTSLPSEYASRVHDTASLFIGGTKHNQVNQSFKTIGISFNTAYTFYAKKKTGFFVSYGFNYRLLRKANT
ncbi:MAG TPA: hypothetical protein VGF79_02565, partial [Bacteroidia bacterium]